MKQSQALNVMLSGESVFLTGAPGAGKTYVLNQYIKHAKKKGKRVAVTASTGIAATHIGGSTIHSWSGLGIRDQLSSFDKDWLRSNSRMTKRYNETDVLVIDEISMLHGVRLDMVNTVCKLLRGNEQPFGGMQVILVGDLFQLPPVTRDNTVLDFAHTSASWAELNPKICYLSEQHRQKGDELLDVLEAMRGRELNDWHEEILSGRLGAKPEAQEQITRLYAHNIDVEELNRRYLERLDSESETFQMRSTGAKAKVEQLMKGILTPAELELKIGAEVMFVANNPSSGYVNGTRGRVISFTADGPRVQLAGSSKVILVEPYTWRLEEDNRQRAEVEQLPLRLAWAITIHKSQGMSLDAAEIDLSKSFTPGMGYVALSRIRSLKGLYLSGINRMAMQLNPQIYEFDAELRKASTELAARTPELIEDISEPDVTEQAVDAVLLDKLKEWRLSRSSAENIPAYIVAHNTMLEEIARNKPTTAQQLLGIKGLGPKKIENYGEEILSLLTQHLPAAVSTPMPESGEQAQEILPESRAEIIRQYPRAYQRWQPDEDEQLLHLFRDKVYFPEVCQTLQRQPAGVWARLSYLLGEITVDTQTTPEHNKRYN